MSWLLASGIQDESLEKKLAERVAERIAAKEYTLDDSKYIAAVSFLPCSGNYAIPDERMQKLRTVCQLWDVKLQPSMISSHRKVVGPLIVGLKRILLPIMKALWKDTLHQQRSYNAAVTSLLADLTEEVARLSKKS